MKNEFGNSSMVVRVSEKKDMTFSIAPEPEYKQTMQMKNQTDNTQASLASSPSSATKPAKNNEPKIQGKSDSPTVAARSSIRSMKSNSNNKYTNLSHFHHMNSLDEQFHSNDPGNFFYLAHQAAFSTGSPIVLEQSNHRIHVNQVNSRMKKHSKNVSRFFSNKFNLAQTK